MGFDWIGRYKAIVYELIYYSNVSNRMGGMSHEYEGIRLGKVEYQILGYVCIHENDNKILKDISLSLGISQSNISKALKTLIRYDLVSKYKFKNDNKRIILKPTELGKKVFSEITTYDVEPVFKPFFDALENVSEDELAKFEKALGKLSSHWTKFDDAVLEKVED